MIRSTLLNKSERGINIIKASYALIEFLKGGKEKEVLKKGSESGKRGQFYAIFNLRVFYFVLLLFISLYQLCLILNVYSIILFCCHYERSFRLRIHVS